MFSITSRYFTICAEEGRVLRLFQMLANEIENSQQKRDTVWVEDNLNCSILFCRRYNFERLYRDSQWTMRTVCVHCCFQSSRLKFRMSSIHSLGNPSRRRFRGFTFQRALDLVNDRYDVSRPRPCVFGSCELVNNARLTLDTFETNDRALYLVQIDRLWEWISQSLTLESDRKSFVVADKVLNYLRVHGFVFAPYTVVLPAVRSSESDVPKTSLNDSDSINFIFRIIKIKLRTSK